MDQIWIDDLSMQSGLLDLGNQPISETLQHTLVSGNDETDTVLINASTICRNLCMSAYPAEVKKNIMEEGKMEMVVDNVTNTLRILVSTLRIAFMHKPCFPLPRHIIAYLFDYDKIIPSQFYRVPTDRFTLEVECRLKARMHTRQVIKYEPNDMLMEYYPEPVAPSYVILNELVQSLQNRHNVIMVSHHPIDYHIFRYVNKFNLVTSFTGAYEESINLNKIVFDRPWVPFTPEMHVLFGDKTDVRSAVMRKSKRELSNIIEKESWIYLPQDKVNDRLNQLQISQPYHL